MKTIRAVWTRENHRMVLGYPGARGHYPTNTWHFPATPFGAQSIFDLALEVRREDEGVYAENLIEAQSIFEVSRRRDNGELTPQHDPSWGVNSPLWSHQLQAVEFARNLPACLFHMGMGTGKSLAAIRLILEREHKRVLIVCPKAAIRNWIGEWERHCAGKFAAKPIDGDAKKRLARIRDIFLTQGYEGPRIAVVNYESLWRPQPFADFLLSEEAGIDLVVWDEIQRLKAPGGKASRFAARLAYQVPFKLGLSGTPEPHSPLDSYGVFRSLDAGIFGTDFKRFEDRYAIKGGFENRQVVGYKNEDEYAERRRRIVFRVKTEDAIDLPPVQHRRVDVRLQGHALAAYRELRDEFVTEVGEGRLTADHALTRMLRLQQLTSGHLVDDDGQTMYEHRGKILEFEREMMNIESDEPVVVFCRFRWDIDTIVSRARKMLDRHAYELSGKKDELEEWQNAAGGEMLVVQVQTGSEAINLTRARYAFYFSIGYSLGQYEQSLARINRPGQTRPVVYTHLVTANAIDSSVYKALDNRRKVLDEILDEAKEGRFQ